MLYFLSFFLFFFAHQRKMTTSIHTYTLKHIMTHGTWVSRYRGLRADSYFSRRRHKLIIVAAEPCQIAPGSRDEAAEKTRVRQRRCYCCDLGSVPQQQRGQWQEKGRDLHCVIIMVWLRGQLVLQMHNLVALGPWMIPSVSYAEGKYSKWGRVGGVGVNNRPCKGIGSTFPLADCTIGTSYVTHTTCILCVIWKFFLVRCEVLGQGCLCVQIVKHSETNL